jgi:hypothetical protein
MSQENINLTSYFHEGKLILPSGFIENPKDDFKPSMYNYAVPDAVKNRPDHNFVFKYSTTSKHIPYEWYSPSDHNLDTNIIIARPINFNLQRIVGPRDFVEEHIEAYYILDNYFPNSDFHLMDIVASLAIDEMTFERLNPQIKYWTQMLLNSLNINKTLDNTDHILPDEEAPFISIYPDVEWSCFLAFYYIGLPRYPKYIRNVANIIHEITHMKLGSADSDYERHRQEVQTIKNEIIIMTALWLRTPLTARESFYLGKSIDSGSRYMNDHSQNLDSHFEVLRKITGIDY